MKQHQREQELTSLDRLEILRDRVYTTIDEYKTLLYSLEKAFKNSDLDLADTLSKVEHKLIKQLENRVKIFKAEIKYSKTKDKRTQTIESELYDKLRGLNKFIKNYKIELELKKETLKNEIPQVRKITGSLGKIKDETAWRIDILT